MSTAAAEWIVRAVVRCDGAPIPPGWGGPGWEEVPVHTRGAADDLVLRADALGAKVTGRLDKRASDLARIAAYAFAADQLLSRGGKGDPNRWRWRRELALAVPVADPGFWSDAVTIAALAEALGFGTDDAWSFAFAPAGPEPGQQRLDIHYDDRERLAGPDCVAMLSGGMDSLCGAVDAVAVAGCKPVLVSHRTAPHVGAPQRALVAGLKARFPAWSFPQMSFRVHLRNQEALERTRRTRGFLVAALGAAVAGQVGLPIALVPDNGYVSINPPVNAQLVGALNSRGTHPTFLRLVNRLLALAFPAGVRVENPLADRTRAEALRALASHECAHLLPDTRSCAKSRQPAAAPHCGVCSQCVDRRFAAVAAGLEDHDPAGRYGIEIFTGPLPPGEGRIFAVSYVGFAQRVEEQGTEGLFLDYPELELCLDPDAPDLPADAERLAGVLRRHSGEVVDALGAMVQRHGHAIARRRLRADCLLMATIREGSPGPGRPAADDEEADVLDGQATAHAPAEDAGQDRPPPRHRLEHHGKSWWIAFGDEKDLVDHSVGMTRLARLLKAPGQSLTALDLVAGSGPGRQAPRVREEDDHGPGDPDGLVSAEPGGLGPRVDDEARRQYEARSAELQEKRANAEEIGDEDEVARIDAEMDDLTNEILASTGKRGHARMEPDEHEKARQTVAQTVAKAIDEIGRKLRGLRIHLDQSLRLGVRCRYDPRQRQSWHVDL